MRIEIELMYPDISAERKAHLEEEMKMHLNDAVTQRRIWGNFVLDYVARVDPNLKLPDNALPVPIGEDEPVYSHVKSQSFSGRPNGGRSLYNACGG